MGDGTGGRRLRRQEPQGVDLRRLCADLSDPTHPQIIAERPRPTEPIVPPNLVDLRIQVGPDLVSDAGTQWRGMIRQLGPRQMNHRLNQSRPNGVLMGRVVWNDVPKAVSDNAIGQRIEVHDGRAGDQPVQQRLPVDVQTSRLIEQPVGRRMRSRVLGPGQHEFLVARQVGEGIEVRHNAQFGNALCQTRGVFAVDGVRFRLRLQIHPSVGGLVQNCRQCLRLFARVSV
ncbi:hypothetical protein AB0E63_13515 [Kribbella sp. NPDC026596]|uniref:hypothetical protein n=1 Tax=Kribbella sp. NPDC026596 TaxID=3155122 RepID=UPI0033C8324B